MPPVEYKLARRERIREILIDIAAGAVSSLLVTALTSLVKPALLTQACGGLGEPATT